MRELVLQPEASLELLEIGEPDTNSLRVVAIEVMPNGPHQSIPDAPTVIATPVTATEASRTFEVLWDNYVSYLVENESYVVTMDPALSGRGLKVTSSSALLDFVAPAESLARAVKGPLQHWCLVCAWHVVHVISAEPPVIRIV